MGWEDTHPDAYKREMDEGDIEEIVENAINDFYFEVVVPLENQLKELGYKPKRSTYETISFRPNSMHEYYRENKWEMFFTFLMGELWDAGFLIRPENSDWRLKEKMNPNTMNFVRCFDGVIGLVQGADQPTWQENGRGGLELCVYMIDELIRMKIISDHKKNKMIEKVFGIKDPARKRAKFSTYHNTDYKPKRHKEIDDIISNAQKRLAKLS